MTQKVEDFTSKSAVAGLTWLLFMPLGYFLAYNYQKHADRLREEGYVVTGDGCLVPIINLTFFGLVLAGGSLILLGILLVS